MASGLVFPRSTDEWPDLEPYYWKHKRLVIAGILIPNVIIFVQTTIVHPATFNWAFYFAQITYWPPVILLLFSRRKWQDLVLPVIAIGS